LATALLGGAALAADLPTRKEAPAFAPPPPVATWTGFYIGVNGGYAGDQFKYPASGNFDGISASGSADLTSSGFLGGVQAGYNWQFATSWVAGLEADIDAASIKGQIGLGGSGSVVDLGSGSASATAGSQTDYLGTVRARLGFLVTDQFLVFATGGLAYGQVKSGLNASANIPDLVTGTYALSKTTTRTGWTAGAGVEYMLNKNWTFKTEYLYVDLGEAGLIGGAGEIGDGGSYSYNLKVHATDNIVRAGLNYRFN
jgi:outer membrane immunogenic protein